MTCAMRSGSAYPPREMVEIPPLPPEGATDLRAMIDGVPYHAIPRGTPAELKASGHVSAVEWQVATGEWELIVNNDVVALRGSGSRQINADDRLRVRFR